MTFQNPVRDAQRPDPGSDGSWARGREPSVPDLGARATLLGLLVIAFAGCLPATDSREDIVECEATDDCNAGAGEICDLGVCWGDPPAGRYAAVVTPPAELRKRLVKTAIPELTMDADGTLGNGIDHALIFAEGVTVRGRVSIPCPTGLVCTGRYALAGTVRFAQAAAFPGGPRLVESDDVGADGLFEVVVQRPRAGTPITFTMTFTPSVVAANATARIAAEFLAPIAAEVKFDVDDIDADTGEIAFDVDADPYNQRTLRGVIARPVVDGSLDGWRVAAEVVTNPVLGSRQVVSTLTITDEEGAFELRLAPDVDVIDLVVAPPSSADPDHWPSVRLRDRVVTATVPVIDIPSMGQPSVASVAVTAVDGSGATVDVAGATVLVQLTQAAGSGRELAIETRLTTVGGRASLPLFGTADGAPLRYRVDVLPPTGDPLASRFDQALVPVDGPLEVTLPRRVAMAGKLKDHDGRPVEGATVSAAVSTASLCVLSSAASRIALGQAPTQATTNHKGEFTLFVDRELAGTAISYDVTVRPASGDPRPEWTFTERDPQASADLLLPDGAHLRGLVLAADQGPVVQAALTVYEQIDDVPTCVSALGAGGVAVVRGRGESDDQGSAAVVLPRAIEE